MSQIPPFAYYLQYGTQVQREQALERDRQVRRTQNLEKDVALEDDELEHQVESTDQVSPVGDSTHNGEEAGSGRQNLPDRDAKNEAPPHIDVTA